MPRSQRRDGELITKTPVLYADHRPDRSHFPPLQQPSGQVIAGMPDACPTPRWCSTHGPCQSDGCRYDGEKDWPPAA